MVHTFEIDGIYYLFDVESSALHVCDALTTQVINKMQGKPYFLEGADPEVVEEITADIKELTEHGLLFAKRTTVQPVKSEYLKAL